MSIKKKYGAEHLRFSRNTYRTRKVLLITSVLAILYFEYEIVDDLTLYSVKIPKSLVELSLFIGLTWSFIQFLFLAIDDYIDWKKVYLIKEKETNIDFPGISTNSTILLEIESFSKGKIKYRGMNLNELRDYTHEMELTINYVEQHLRDFERRMKNEVKSLEQFQKWYKNYSIFTLIRFSILEFSLPLLLGIYAGVICHFYPILPL